MTGRAWAILATLLLYVLAAYIYAQVVAGPPTVTPHKYRYPKGYHITGVTVGAAGIRWVLRDRGLKLKDRRL